MNNPAIKKSEYALAIFGLGLLLLAVATSLHYKNLNLFILELFCDVVAINGGISYLKPELFAFACIVSIGLSVIICFPVTNFLTWDDEVHYGNANSFSYLTNAEAIP